MELMSLFRPNIRRMAAHKRVDSLIRALAYEKDYRIRHLAARFLGVIGDGKALDPLIRSLSDTHPMVRSGAAQALGKLDDPRAIESLIVALMDPERAVHTSAMKSLKRIGGFRALLLLVDVVAFGKDDHFRAITSDVLVELDDKRAVEPLVQVLKQRSPKTRGLAVRTLGRMAAVNAVGHLIPLLKDPDTGVQRQTLRALRKISGKHFDETPGAWWEWWVQNVIESSITFSGKNTESVRRRYRSQGRSRRGLPQKVLFQSNLKRLQI